MLRKLKRYQVERIFKAKGVVSQVLLAKKYGVSQVIISRIHRGESYPEIINELKKTGCEETRK